MRVEVEPRGLFRVVSANRIAAPRDPGALCWGEALACRLNLEGCSRGCRPLSSGGLEVWVSRLAPFSLFLSLISSMPCLEPWASSFMKRDDPLCLPVRVAGQQ